MRARMVEPRMAQAMAQPSQMKPMASESSHGATHGRRAAGQPQAREIARAVVAADTRAVSAAARAAGGSGGGVVESGDDGVVELRRSALDGARYRRGQSDARGSTSSTTQRAFGGSIQIEQPVKPR